MRQRRLFWLGVFLVLPFILGCPRPKPKPPEPPKPPAVETITWGLVRANGPTLIDAATSQPIDAPGAILCCPEIPPPGWPMISPAAIDALPPFIGFVHGRPGPFLAAAESEYAQLGGGYLEVNGKADLDRWNEPFWAAFDASVIRAGQRHMRYQASILDGWYCSAAQDPGVQHPWHFLHNVQGEHVLADCGKTLTPRQAAWVRKVVETVGRHANVIWESSNEEFGIPGYRPEWTFAMRRLVQQVERERGFPAHMFGAQSESDITQSGDVDYNSQHWVAPAPAPLYGKPTIVNEQNPNPPYTPEAQRSMYCTAKAAGTYWWLWRGGQTPEQWARTLELVAQGCEGVPIGGCPEAVPETRGLNCKVHGVSPTGEYLYDCTPQRPSGGPIYPEGNGEVRLACETLSMCGASQPEACIDFRLVNVSGDLRIVRKDYNGFAVVVAGHGTADLDCRIKAQDAHFQGCVLPDGSHRISQ